MMRGNVIFELRMAWRETRPAFRRFLFLIIAIALGVGALTGLRGFSVALDRSISRSARDLIAADIAVRFSSLPSPKEVEILESLTARGAQLSRTTETLSMVSSAKTSDPILSEIRAVDPMSYPFFGTVELEPPAPLRTMLSDDAAIVSQDLLIRTGSTPGDVIQIGSARYRIAAILKSEPDRIAFGVNLGPRILITRKGLERSGLIQFGSRASESFLFRLPASGLSLDKARAIITAEISRRIRIVDYRNPNPSVSRGLERATGFLSLIGLLALLLGGLGVSTTIHAYLRQKLDSIAILKCLGGRSNQIMRIYLAQGAVLGVLGSALGVGIGYIIQLLFPKLLKGWITLPAQLELAPGAALQGFCVGIFTTLLFLLPPLLAIRRVSPIRVFLREMPDTPYSALKRLQRDPLPLIFSLLLFAGIGLIASWLAESLRGGFTFLAALVCCMSVLGLTAKLLLMALRKIPRLSSLVLRQGLKNLNRPGNQAISILVALGLGVAFVLTVYFIQTSLISQIVKSAPADFPNVFLLGVTQQDRAGLQDFLNNRSGAVANALIPDIPSRLSTVDGRTADQLEMTPHEQRHFRGEFSLTWAESIPPDTRIVQGRWWRPPYPAPMISVGEEAARQFKIRLGSILEFDISGRKVRGEVVNIRDIEFSRPGISNQFIFSPGVLDDFPVSYIGTVRMQPSRVAGFQSSLFKQFPNITSIDVGQVLVRIQDLLDKMSAVIRFVAVFAIISGIIILASSVVSTRYQRIREAILFKTLGATRSQVAGIQAAEFLIIGSAAGLVGSILAAIAAYFLLGKLLNTDFDFQWMPLLVTTAATAILSITTGWLASRGVLNHKPLEILREN
jgi:putative ABC transport system permease protein